MITEDKALLCLMRNFDQLKNRDAWQGPAGILATLLTVMVTTAPQDRFGVPKEAWAILGLGSMFMTGIWLILTLYRRFAGKHVDPDSIVRELKAITAASPGSGN